jgi:hypothetical protein
VGDDGAIVENSRRNIVDMELRNEKFDQKALIAKTHLMEERRMKDR